LQPPISIDVYVHWKLMHSEIVRIIWKDVR